MFDNRVSGDFVNFHGHFVLDPTKTSADEPLRGDTEEHVKQLFDLLHEGRSEIRLKKYALCPVCRGPIAAHELLHSETDLAGGGKIDILMPKTSKSHHNFFFPLQNQFVLNFYEVGDPVPGRRGWRKFDQ